MSPTTRRAQAIPAGSPGHCIHSLPEDSPAHESRFCHASASRRSAAAARRNRAGRSLGCEATLTHRVPCQPSRHAKEASSFSYALEAAARQNLQGIHLVGAPNPDTATRVVPKFLKADGVHRIHS